MFFEQCSQVEFRHNIGDKGGAIFLSGDASIVVANNSNLSFVGNNARLGGAIYALPLQTHFVEYDDVCFLQRVPVKKTGGQHFYTTFLFQHNVAQAYPEIGNDIFVSSLSPCSGLCKSWLPEPQVIQLSFPDAFFTSNCIGNFTNGIPDFVTEPVNLTIEQAADTAVPLYPGITQPFNIIQSDERGQDVGRLFPVWADSRHAV